MRATKALLPLAGLRALQLLQRLPQRVLLGGGHVLAARVLVPLRNQQPSSVVQPLDHPHLDAIVARLREADA